MAPPGILKGKKALLSEQRTGGRKKEGHVCFMSSISPWQTVCHCAFHGKRCYVAFLYYLNTKYVTPSVNELVYWVILKRFSSFITKEKKNTFFLIRSPVSPKECKVQGTVIQCE